MRFRKDRSIFVSVASFADPECPKTVAELFSKAAKPELVYVGVCQQNREEDVDCKIEAAVKPEFKRHIRIIRLDHREARGPTHARYLCATLWAGENYFMQVDSHSLLVQDWDNKLIRMIQVAKESGVSQKPIISGYPKEYEPGKDAEDDDEATVPMMCRAFFDSRNLISFDGSESLPPPSDGVPQVNAFVAGGLLFGESSFLEEVPFDPNLPQLFVGEEILHSARFWTWGYDILSPTENVIRHYYTRPSNYKYWDLKNRPTDDAAVQKVKVLLKLDKNAKIADHLKENLDMYSLGKVRPLEDYFKHAGIDPDKKIVTKNFCRKENGFKNKDNISHSATKKPKEKFVEIEGFMGEDGIFNISGGEDFEYDSYEPFAMPVQNMCSSYTDKVHNMNKKILLGLLILGTIMAWIWYSQHFQSGRIH